ncbi:Acetyltransferase GNAT family [Penicillium subrubescens]|uniref:Acetyltransferase GNAT family n=1 Tax=Penicillium subrubescens TaxID=1316194 RepID=UPI002545A329|nr:Acetyltransferase GNAT family [Penicillium subrubescens]KAJ5886122.1 Acetyltransferase GNAT family [Penicillium subrubescens]
MPQYGYEDMFYSSDEGETLISPSAVRPDVPIHGQAFAGASQAHAILNNGSSLKEPMPTSHGHTPDSSDPKPIVIPGKDIRITRIANTASEHIAALRLVADSVAHQQQLAALAILFNPFFLGLILPVAVVIHYFAYKGHIKLPTLAFITVAVLMAFVTLMKRSVSGYLHAAEKVGTRRWLYCLEEATTKKARGHDALHLTIGDCNCRRVRPREGCQKRDLVLVARLDPSDEIIGTIILRVIPITHFSNPVSQSNRSEKRCRKSLAPLPNCKAIIRAWTVKQGHRGAGIGAWMLKDVILLCLKYGWMGPEFAKDHENSARVLPRRLNEDVDGWALPDIL